MGLGGHVESRAGTGGSFLTALDYKTGKAALAPQVRGRRGRWRRRADDRGQARVRRRRRRQHRRARRVDRHAAVALEDRRRHQPAADVPARRPPVPARRDRRHAVGVCDVLIRLSASSFQLLVPLVPFSCRSWELEAGSFSASPPRRCRSPAVVVELHVRDDRPAATSARRCRRSAFEIISAVSRWPNGLSCVPACQIDTFSAFQVSTGPTVIAFVGTRGMLPPPLVRAFCAIVSGMQIDHARGQLAIFGGGRRRVLVSALARQRDR